LTLLLLLVRMVLLLLLLLLCVCRALCFASRRSESSCHAIEAGMHCSISTAQQTTAQHGEAAVYRQQWQNPIHAGPLHSMAATALMHRQLVTFPVAKPCMQSWWATMQWTSHKEKNGGKKRFVARTCEHLAQCCDGRQLHFKVIGALVGHIKAAVPQPLLRCWRQGPLILGCTLRLLLALLLLVVVVLVTPA
jgi:hypothetical protein